MAKFHISASGEPGECKATERNCPLGEDTPHGEFSNLAEAKGWAERYLEAKHSPLAVKVRKNELPVKPKSDEEYRHLDSVFAAAGLVEGDGFDEGGIFTEAGAGLRFDPSAGTWEIWRKEWPADSETHQWEAVESPERGLTELGIAS